MEFLRIAQIFDDFLQLGLGLVDAGDIVERHPSLALGQKPGARFAEAHRLAAARLHLAHEKDPHADQQQHREPGQQNAQERHAAFGRGGGNLHLVGTKGADQSRIVRGKRIEFLAVDIMAGQRLALNGDIRHLAGFHIAHELGECQFMARAARRAALKQLEKRHQQQTDDDPKRYILAEITQPNTLMPGAALTRASPEALFRVNESHILPLNIQ